MTTLGRGHTTIRLVRSLRRDRSRRDAEGLFLAEGFHLAAEALSTRVEVMLAITSPAIERSDEGVDLRERLRTSGVEVHETTDAVLQSLQDARSPQPLLLVVRRAPTGLAEVLDATAGVPLVMATHGLQDPGNLGSVLRTAEAAGATGLVACGEGVDLFHPRVVRATMGSIFRLPVATAEAEPVLDELRHRGIESVAADPRAPDGCDDADMTRPTALWLGSEGGGLPKSVLDRVSRRVRIPMAPGVESLSAGAAAAVLLYEAHRQRNRREL
jgi:TrmH family RNA methyltransferase